jgi:UDP-N-acetyl-D-galactosamine dehydrogenase
VGVTVQVADPIASAQDIADEYGIKLMPFESLRTADAVILAVAHEHYLAKGWPLVSQLLRDGKGIVLDVKAKLDRSKRPQGVDLWRL